MSDEKMVVEVGMEWPVMNPKTGKPVTSGTAKQIWLKGLEPACVAASDGKDNAAAVKLKQVLTDMPDRDWRYGYADIVEEWTRIQAEASPGVALQMCDAGLHALSCTMRYRCADHTTISARDAVFHAAIHKTVPTVPRTVTIRGEAEPPATTTTTGGFVFASPRVVTGNKTRQHVQMTGSEAEAQFKAWRDYGCMEPSACQSATAMAHGDIPILNQLQDKVFVVLGATSALGPAKTLLELGATVAAIARPNSSKLTELQSYARTQTCGTLLLPSLFEEDDDETSVEVVVGANLMQHAPHLAQWITSPEVCPTANTQIILCSQAYLDGEANVRACVAMDLIAEYVCLHHPNNTALSFLISPGTVHAVPEEAAMDAKRRYEKTTPFWHKALTTMTTSQLQPSYTWLLDDDTNKDTPNDGTKEEDTVVRVLNGLSLVQGPNYALSKTAQMWRSMLATSQGHTVSCPLAPPSRTDSMVSHSTVSAALDGMPYLEPLVIFDQEPCRTLMTALMLHDIFQPKQDMKQHHHPLQLFFHNSVHGGMWRSPYLMESVSAISFIFGKVGLQPSGWSPDAAMAPM